MTEFLAYCFAALTLFAASMVVTTRHTVRSVLFLILSFIGAAGLWLLSGAEFLAITLVLVYVGAVMVLFLFVVMMLDVDREAYQQKFSWILPVVLFAIVLGTLIVVKVNIHDVTALSAHASGVVKEDNARILGQVLYTEYLLPFALAGVLLLVAMIAAIGITFYRSYSRGSSVSRQVSQSKAQRLRLIDLRSRQEPKQEKS